MNNCSDTTMVLPLGLSKPVAVDFDGGDLTSDAGLILLTLADRKAGITAAVSDSLRDQRQRSKVSHSLQELVRGRVLSIAAGYADANDMDTLRQDPALKVAVGRCPLSEEALASQPTLSRFENSVTKRELLSAGLALAERVIAQLPDYTKSIVLDIDATDDPCHGQQVFEGFNAYYDSHCYMPLLMHLTDEQGRSSRWLHCCARGRQTPWRVSWACFLALSQRCERGGPGLRSWCVATAVLAATRCCAAATGSVFASCLACQPTVV